MPLSKKRKPEHKKHRNRDRQPGAAAPAAEPAPSSGGGLLTKMRGGIRNVAGTGPKKPESLVSKIVTWVLIAAAAFFVLKRFGIIP